VFLIKEKNLQAFGGYIKEKSRTKTVYTNIRHHLAMEAYDLDLQLLATSHFILDTLTMVPRVEVFDQH
jgi:hypothetical protein